jgi:hypothetical protein
MFWGRKYFSQCRRFGQIKLDSSLIDDPPVTLFLNRPTWHNQNQTGLEIPNSKSQISSKFQFQMIKTLFLLIGILVIGNYLLFDTCNVVLLKRSQPFIAILPTISHVRNQCRRPKNILHLKLRWA